MSQGPQSSQRILRQGQPCPRGVRDLKREDAACTPILTLRTIEEVEDSADEGVAGMRDAVLERVGKRRALGKRR